MSQEAREVASSSDSEPSGPRLARYFEAMVRADASDLHLKPDLPPHLRISGEIRSAKGPSLSSADIFSMADEMMSDNTATAEPGDYLTFYVVLDNPRNPFRGGSRGEDVIQVGCYAFGLDLSTNLQFVTKDLPAADKRP